MEIGCGAVWRVTQAGSVVRDGVPLVFDKHFVPR